MRPARKTAAALAILLSLLLLIPAFAQERSGTAVGFASIISGTISGITSFAIRDTSAAFDVTLTATSAPALTAGRALTIDMSNVAHTLDLGATANSIAFPNTASYTVVGSGDTGTVTNTMLAGSIAASKLIGTDITTVGALAAGSIASGFGTIATANTIETTNTTASTSATTGALKSGGGLGVAGAIWAGTTVNGVGLSSKNNVASLFDGLTIDNANAGGNGARLLFAQNGALVHDITDTFGKDGCTGWCMHFRYNSADQMTLGTAGLMTIGRAGVLQGSLALAGVTSGALTLKAPAVAGAGTLTLPDGTTDFSATGAAGAYVRQNSAGGALTVAATTTAQATPSNPTGTTNTTGLMMGLAGAITPTNSGKVLVIISGTCSNDTILDGGSIQIRMGTGTAPVNGAALTGTAYGGKPRFSAAVAAEFLPCAVNAVVPSLTPSTAYWIDLGLAAITGGTASIADVSISAVEL